MLSTPNRDKCAEFGFNDEVCYGAVSMQGWRLTNEDSHVAHLNLPNKEMFFGVFDGHGGSEVARIVSEEILQKFVNAKGYEEKNYKEALINCFKDLDSHLLLGKTKKEIIESKQKVC
jgi:serine/threonine protein phosphatase PrpC